MREGQGQLANVINGAPAYSIPKRGPGDPSPLSFSQQRLWFLDQLMPGDPTYNIPYAMTIEGDLDVGALQQAFNAVVERHEVLRTVFRNVDGTPATIVKEGVHVPLKRGDLRSLPESERQKELARIVQAEAYRGFNLSRDCMLRALLVQLNDDRYVLVHVSHHIAWEFRSTALLYSNLGPFYDQFSARIPARLQDLPIQFADFALWQRKFLQGDMLRRLAEYWKQQLSEAPNDLNLPADFPRAAAPSQRGRRYPIALESDLLERARVVSLNSGVTPFTSLFAAFSVFLYCYSGQEDLCVGSPIARRRRDEIEPLIGFFVNTLVLRADLFGAPSFRELLARLSRVVLGAIANADLPFDKLVEVLKPPRKSGRMPLFQVNFRVVKEPVPSLQLNGLHVSPPEWIDNETSKFDLSLELVATGGAPGFFEYSTELFKEETIAQMALDFKLLLRSLVDQPDTALRDLQAVRDVRCRVNGRRRQDV